jgi:hypothetical protein
MPLVAFIALACGDARTPDASAAAADAGADALVRETERGPVRVTVSVTPAAPSIGDTLVLTIDVRAEPRVEVLMPEFGEVLDRFRILDFAPEEGLADGVASRFTQRYRLAADRSGPQRIPPIAVEFVDRRPGQREAPDGADAYELLTEPLALDVASVLPSEAELSLRPALGPLPPLRTATPWLVAALALALGLAAAAPFVWRALGAARASRERRSAYDVARAELDALLRAGLPDPASMDPFFVALSRIVRRYLEARFALRSPELTTEEFLEVMVASPDLSGAHQQLLQSFLRQADLVKFAHHVPSGEDVLASVEAAERFLVETRPASTATGTDAARRGGASRDAGDMRDGATPPPAIEAAGGG